MTRTHHTQGTYLDKQKHRLYALLQVELRTVEYPYVYLNVSFLFFHLGSDVGQFLVQLLCEVVALLYPVLHQLLRGVVLGVQLGQCDSQILI